MSVGFVLSAAGVRVLGALMEKEMTTPDLYPLSVNALIAASNQRSSRDPVMELSEDEVRTALHELQDLELVAAARDGGRVARFEHRIRTVLTLRRDETAVLCLLLLRGAQTPGELRSRAERMFSFDDLAAVQGTLDRLAGREVALVAALARAPGSREVRYGHLLGGEVAAVSVAELPVRVDELGELREMIEALARRVAALEGGAGVGGGALAGDESGSKLDES